MIRLPAVAMGPAPATSDVQMSEWPTALAQARVSVAARVHTSALLTAFVIDRARLAVRVHA